MPLKILVWSMGLVLAGGFAFVVATLINGVPAMLPKCVKAEIVLPEKGNFRILSASNELLRVVVEASPTEQQLLNIDLCSGNVLQKTVIKTTP